MSETPAGLETHAREASGEDRPGVAPPARTGKAVARRIDLSYHKRPHAMRTVRRGFIVMATVGAVAWVVVALVVRGERIYNPGPVAASHAMFENNCSACHDGGGEGGRGQFFKAVSDAACLRCHNAGVHSVAQTSLVAMDRASNKPVHSSNCTHCHVEHRGHDVLAGRSDLNCTSCHADLKANVAIGRTQLANSVTAFAPGRHPAFGRRLEMDSAGKLVSPMVLHFDHAFHLEKYPKMECSRCHSTTDAWPAPGPAQNAALPPYASEGKDRPAGWSASAGRRDMLPISYERHCAACHEIWLPGTSDKVSPASGQRRIRHESMARVREQIAQGIAGTAAAGGTFTKQGAPAAEEPKKGGRFAKRETKTAAVSISRDEWLTANAAFVLDELVRGGIAARSKSELPLRRRQGRTADDALRAIPKEAWGGGDRALANAIEFHVTYSSENACALCHGVTSTPAAGNANAADGLRLNTVSTGIPSETRRWLPAAVFDHDAHRAMDCLQCHTGVDASRSGADLHLPSMQSCLECHNAAGGRTATASSSCVTCHFYHERTGPVNPAKRVGLKELAGPK